MCNSLFKRRFSLAISSRAFEESSQASKELSRISPDENSVTDNFLLQVLISINSLPEDRDGTPAPIVDMLGNAKPRWWGSPSPIEQSSPLVYITSTKNQTR
jgi:hypothetical protein